MRKSLYAIAAMLFIAFTTAAQAAETQPAQSPSSSTTHAAVVAAGVVNLNSADAVQLALLPRVGAKAAQRIIDYRKEHGAFKKTSDLMQVKGFGEKTFERLSPYLTVSGSTTLAAKVKSPSTRKAVRKTSVTTAR
jgi:competence protein ComEA